MSFTNAVSLRAPVLLGDFCAFSASRNYLLNGWFELTEVRTDGRSHDSLRVLFRLVQYPYLVVPSGVAFTMRLRIICKIPFFCPVELGGSCLFGAQECPALQKMP